MNPCLMILATCWPRRSLEFRRCPTNPETLSPSHRLHLNSIRLCCVGPRSTLIINILEINRSFLAESDWKCRPEYEAAKASPKRLSPLKDSAERAMGTSNGNITRDEESFQYLVLVVEAHRKQHGIKNKTN